MTLIARFLELSAIMSRNKKKYGTDAQIENRVAK